MCLCMRVGLCVCVCVHVCAYEGTTCAHTYDLRERGGDSGGRKGEKGERAEGVSAMVA